ncbi:MAG: membrane protein insertion efficiency factor YidD [Bacilli bacterium]|jgi:hypothetical protein|nr:membrane protein insertion efficiency factor YidD [Bacilli bacterium]MDD2681583.1 membrane protein insertion efficiency factor YidD [Bacilli bacterium]MDD3121531.1 membrane protein insertion efficiency factor YidD [Bacilli bacterium]MDD4062802.1 membrane protein insertion efficiency factor YidD [Bacilli bacterium]MDD4482243.1 membrane protein insertion efficiency factor YidD [Bacilli bacterium]
MRKLAIKLIRFYQTHKIYDTAHCKYSPTCSNYAIGVYEKFNFFKASFLTFYRILRCNPFSKGGYDPVPLTKLEKKLKNTAPKVTNETSDVSKKN